VIKSLRASSRHLAGVALIAVAAQASAKTEIVPSASVTASAGYSSNPFLTAQGNDATATASISVTPSLAFIDTASQAILSAEYNRTEYISKYPGLDAYSISFAGSHRFNDRLSVSLGTEFESSVLGANGANFSSPISAFPTQPSTDGSTTTAPGSTSNPAPSSTPSSVAPLPTVGLIGDDVSLIGQRQRRNLLATNIAFSYLPSARSTWNFGANASRATYPGSSVFAQNSTSYGGQIGYTRRLSETQTLGVQGGVSIVEYSAGQTSRIYTPRLTYNRRLSPSWTLDVSAGLGITDDGSGARVKGLAIVGLCHSGVRSQFCLEGSRQPSVNAIGGTLTQTSVTGSYSYRLSERSVVTASGSYIRVDGAPSLLPGNIAGTGDQNYVSADLSINRRLSRQIFLFGAASYRNVTGSNRNVQADVGARIGLSLAFGKAR
jgi:hypothetical protein